MIRFFNKLIIKKIRKLIISGISSNFYLNKKNE